MGHVILPSGTTAWVEELLGSVNLSNLISDVRCDDYTTSYRISIIGALGKLGNNAEAALSPLKDLASYSGEGENQKLIRDAASQAIKKIESGVTPPANDNHVSRRTVNNYGPHGCYSSSYNSSDSCLGGGTRSSAKKPEIQKVEFEELAVGDVLHNDELKVYCRCNFCEKMTLGTKNYRRFTDKLAGPNKFYCHFCVRNDYYHRYNNNIMVLTFRGLIGYYYYSYYIAPKNSPSMYVSEIQDYVELHVKAGLQNPLFRYDPETFCWFVDFNKVGKRKMSVECVLQTIIQQLACFNMYENLRDTSPKKFYEKYHQAVMEFYQNRVRMNGDKVFAPTLWGCGIPDRCSSGVKPIPVDILKGFIQMNFLNNARSGRRS